jgi:hypothetical protein
VDLATLQVVDYQPPQPDDKHEWDASSKRWRKRPEVAIAEARSQAALARIVELERAQLRPMRELAIDANNAEAKRRLAEIEREIVKLRTELA